MPYKAAQPLIMALFLISHTIHSFPYLCRAESSCLSMNGWQGWWFLDHPLTHQTGGRVRWQLCPATRAHTHLQWGSGVNQWERRQPRATVSTVLIARGLWTRSLAVNTAGEKEYALIVNWKKAFCIISKYYNHCKLQAHTLCPRHSPWLRLLSSGGS